jgi:hypothetical protein
LCPLVFTLAVIFKGNGIGAYKVDLNVEAVEAVEADAPAEDDEDDIDWEEG